MTQHDYSPERAARDLAEVAARRRQAATTVVDVLPWWSFPAVGLGIALSVAARDLPPTSPLFWPSLLIFPVTLLGATAGLALRSRARLHVSLMDGRFGAVVAGGAVLMLIVVLGSFFGVLTYLEVNGYALPWTISGAVLGVAFAVTGELFRRALRRALIQSAGEAAR